MDKKVGVYICSGCGIGDAMDAAKLAGVAKKECKIPVATVHPFLCSAEGIQSIRNDIDSKKVNAAVIAACSARVKTESFDFGDGNIVERVNLREHVAWSHTPRDEDTQMLAEDYVRIGVARARKSEIPSPASEEISRDVLVVGGGVAGMTSALEAARAGYGVILVEKEAQLGGFAATLKQRFPTQPPYTQPVRDGVRSLVDETLYNSRIRVITSGHVERVQGQPGMFDVTIRTEVGDSVVRAGAIIEATGWKPYDASRLTHLGYGISPDVITNIQLEKLAAQGELVRPSDGRRPEDVVFIQCAGSRDKGYLSYCSSVCCMATLKHAIYIHEQNAKARIYVIYRDIRTPGQYEAFYRTVQEHPLNFFAKGEVQTVEKGVDGKLAVTVKDTLLGEPFVIMADLVVLATGMTPNSADGERIRALDDARIRMAKAQTEAQRNEASLKCEELKVHAGTEILNLTYRQGPDLPVLAHGFPDSHFVCFPYETRRTGIYAAGSVRAPMDITHAEEDGLGAALKAIQSIELASRGRAVHPRSGDTSFPSFLLQRCTQCKRCTEECPFGALDEDEKGTPRPNIYRCRRCGICMGACPERIISFPNYSVDMIATMVKAIEVPEEDEDKPRVVAFICENDAYPAFDIAGFHHMRYDASVRLIPLRCLGSLNIVWIADALSRGIDGVMLIGCKYGDDYQCHFVKGSELANRRMENVKETLQRLQLEPERIQVTQLAINEYGKLPDLVNGFVERMRKIGPNPYKGF